MAESFRAARRRDPSLVASLRRRERAVFRWACSAGACRVSAASVLGRFGPGLIASGAVSKSELVAWFERHAPDAAALDLLKAPSGNAGRGVGIDRAGSVDDVIRGDAVVSLPVLASRAARGVSAGHLVRGASAAVRAASRAATGRAVEAPADVVAERRRLCWTCPHATVNPRDPERRLDCGKCGCVLASKTRIAGERCPLPGGEARWGVWRGPA